MKVRMTEEKEYRLNERKIEGNNERLNERFKEQKNNL